MREDQNQRSKQGWNQLFKDLKTLTEQKHEHKTQKRPPFWKVVIVVTVSVIAFDIGLWMFLQFLHIFGIYW